MNMREQDAKWRRGHWDVKHIYDWQVQKGKLIPFHSECCGKDWYFQPLELD